MAVVTESFYIPSKVDGLQLSVMTITPDCAPVGIVQISHGMCEHKERYIPIMEFLASKGFACIIHDHRGHGGSVKSEEDLRLFLSRRRKGINRRCRFGRNPNEKETSGIAFLSVRSQYGFFNRTCLSKKIRFYIRRIDYIRMPCLCTRL